jgi:hypothetical protein
MKYNLLPFVKATVEIVAENYHERRIFLKKLGNREFQGLFDGGWWKSMHRKKILWDK